MYSSSSFVRKSSAAASVHEDEDSVGDRRLRNDGCWYNSSEQLLCSLGVPSLDKLFLDGFPVGHILSVREDYPRSTSNYATLLLKCIVAEGLYCGNNIVYIDCFDADTNKFLHTLPSSLQSREDSLTGKLESTSISDEKMQIAWRYRHVKQISEDVPSPKGKRVYDLGGKGMKAEDLAKSNGSRIFPISIFDPDFYNSCIKTVKESIQHSQSRKTITRIIIRSLGSPFKEDAEFCKLLYQIRQLFTNENAIMIYSTPPHLPNPSIFDFYCPDSVIEFQSFVGTRNEGNRSLAEYDGFFKVLKPLQMPCSLSLIIPSSVDLAFKVRRRQLIIDTFYLPPDLSETPSRSTETSPCNSKVDF